MASVFEHRRRFRAEEVGMWLVIWWRISVGRASRVLDGGEGCERWDEGRGVLAAGVKHWAMEESRG